MLRKFAYTKKKIEILFCVYTRLISTKYNNMSAISNNTILADNEPSVCIPRVFANIDRKRIHNVFQTIFGPDVVSQIDMVSRTSENGEEYSRVFVHFTKWPKTMYAQQVRQKLLNGDKVKVVYDEPWYWYMSASRVERPQAPRAREVSAPYIDLSDSSSAPGAGAGKKMERDAHHERLIPRQVMRGGAGGYDRERRQEDTRRHHQEREREREEYHHYPRETRRYENDRREDRDYYRNKGTDYYAQDSRRPRQQQNYHREDDYAPRHHQPRYHNKSKIFTPRTPEIKEWVEKEVPPAPIKSQGRRPVLMLDDDEGKVSRKLDMMEEKSGAGDSSEVEATTVEEETK